MEQRDYNAEVDELLAQRPDLQGELPEAVTDACAAGTPLSEAVAEHEAIQRQNEQSRAMAPVGGVSGSGGLPAAELDDFLRGLNEEY